MNNTKETCIFYKPSTTTLDRKGSKSVLVKTTGHEKIIITVMLLVLAEGRKLTPLVILKGKNLPKAKLPSGITFICNDKGWMIKELMITWLKEV
jgi:hypothetical protein